MATKNTVKTAPKTESNPLLDKMTELGMTAGKGEGALIEAIDVFATAIKGGNSNSMPVAANSGVKELKDAVTKYAEPMCAAYVTGQNTAADRIAVTDKSANTYLSYFVALGMIAVRQPDAIAAIRKSSAAYCKGKTKEQLAGRNALQVYYRAAAVVRDSLFPKKGAAKEIAVAKIEAPAFSKAALGSAKTRTSRKATPKTVAESAPVDTLDALKAMVMECATKLVAIDEVPASVRKALATVQKWK